MMIHQQIFCTILFLATCMACGGSKKKADDYQMPPLPDKDFLTSEKWLHTLNEFIDNHPDEAVLYYRKAEYYFNRDEYDKAQQSINKAIALDKEKGLYLFLKGRIAEAAGKHFQAFDSYEKAEQLGYDLPDLYRASIRTALAANDNAKAKYYLYKLKKIYPERTFSAFFNGMIYLHAGDTAKAIPYLDKCVGDSLSEFVRDAAWQLAEIYKSKKLPGEAIANLRVLYSHPAEERKEKVGEQMAQLYMQIQQPDSALLMSTAVMKQYDTTDVLLDLQASAYEMMHEYSTAAEIRLLAYEKSPTLQRGLSRLTAMEQAGNYKYALAFCDTLYALHKDDAELLKHIYRLKAHVAPAMRAASQKIPQDSLRLSVE